MDNPIYGNYRAKVVDNKDKEKFGRVLVWIPDLMDHNVKEDTGLWARPANNPVGGRNAEEDSEHHFMGSSYIPKIGSWIFVFFECGNINRPYYFGALDLENTPVLPENQLGSNYEDKWTVIKTHAGRCIVISDDPDDERVEITGKKRQITEPPTGDTDSVYTIDDNMSTILFDEREGKEKILIRTYKGDFFHVDIDERKLQAQFESDIHIETKANLYITAAEEIHILAEGDKFNMECATDVNIKAGSNLDTLSGSDTNIKSGANLNEEAATDINMKSGANTNEESGAIMNLKAGSNMNRQAGAIINDQAASAINSDAAMIMDQSGASGPAQGAGTAEDAESATPAAPEGDRDT